MQGAATMATLNTSPSLDAELLTTNVRNFAMLKGLRAPC